MELKLHQKLIFGYLLFIIIQLYFWEPLIVLILNLGLVLVTIYKIGDEQLIEKLSTNISNNITFIAILLIIGSITLIFVGSLVIGSILLILAINILFNTNKED